MFFNTYPYTDGHELNLDWVLAQIHKLHNDWDEFKAINTITNAGAWDITKQYQSWTIVSDNNAGYISLQPVPAGIAISNTDYWGLIADYDILITDLSNRVTDLEGDMTSAEGRLDALEDITSNLHNNDKAKILLIGDSYLDATGAVTNYGDQLAVMMPDAVIYRYSESGSGFTSAGILGHTFENLLSSAITAHGDEYIDHVIVIGGSNDRNANQATLKTFIGSFAAIAKQAYPMAKLSIGMCGWTDMTYGSSDKLAFLTVRDTFKDAAITYNMAYITNIEYVMHDYSQFYDAGHPNTTLQGKIAAFLHQYIKNGSASCKVYAVDSTVTYSSVVSLNQFSNGDLQISATRDDGMTIIRVHGDYTPLRNYGSVALDLTLPANTECFEVASLADGLVYGIENAQIGSYAYNATVVLEVNNNFYPFPASFFIANGKLYCAIQQGIYNSNDITFMKLSPFEIVIPTDFC